MSTPPWFVLLTIQVNMGSPRVELRSTNNDLLDLNVALQGALLVEVLIRDRVQVVVFSRNVHDIHNLRTQANTTFIFSPLEDDSPVSVLAIFIAVRFSIVYVHGAVGEIS